MIGDAPALIDPSRWRRQPVLGVGLSLVLHAGFLVLALLLVPRDRPEPAPPVPVDVEIISPQEFATLEQPPAPAPTPTPVPQQELAAPSTSETTPSTSAPTTAPPVTTSGRHTATRFYARDLLQQPSMARIRRTLGTLADTDRLTQLCNIEGVEQISRTLPGFPADSIVSYAMDDPSISGLTITATGGAVRSRRKWYRLAFTCTAAPNYLSVSAYSFELGEPIPEAEWDERGLNAEDLAE